MTVTAIASAFFDQGQRDILNTLFDELTKVRMALGAATGGTGAGALAGSEVYDPASLADGVGATSTGATITGAALGDLVLFSNGVDLQGITCNAWVSATNTVKTRFQNESGGLLDLVSATIKYLVIPQAAAAQTLAAMLLTKT